LHKNAHHATWNTIVHAAIFDVKRGPVWSRYDRFEHVKIDISTANNGNNLLTHESFFVLK
jgi:hypothetical protein